MCLSTVCHCAKNWLGSATPSSSSSTFPLAVHTVDRTGNSSWTWGRDTSCETLDINPLNFSVSFSWFRPSTIFKCDAFIVTQRSELANRTLHSVGVQVSITPTIPRSLGSSPPVTSTRAPTRMRLKYVLVSDAQSNIVSAKGLAVFAFAVALASFRASASSIGRKSLDPLDWISEIFTHSRASPSPPRSKHTHRAALIPMTVTSCPGRKLAPAGWRSTRTTSPMRIRKTRRLDACTSVPQFSPSIATSQRSSPHASCKVP
mmetsp:Transcript_55890/g.148940  ORF Transcript_55890/g.148940 Transcript_55890/m.148940 type:complete len:260 (-) Transcript_55890:1514-2293(-)